jgi:FlaA1/EpsC-like NDP-sugar epimerase
MKKFLDFFSKLNRRKKITVQITLDVVLLIVSFLGAIFVRLDSLDFARQLPIWGAFFLSILVTLFVLWRLGLYQVIVRFLTGKILVLIGKGVVVAGISLYAAGLFFDANLPRAVPFIFAVLAFLSIGGLRFAARKYFRNPNNFNKRPVIIYGAGEAGLQLLNALFHGNEFSPIAIVDDDSSLHNMDVGGLRVYSPKKIQHLVQITSARVILLAIPTMSRTRRRQIVNSLEDLGLEIKTIPGMSDIISGKTKISKLQTVSAEDLLGRDPVAPDPELIGEDITGRVVMVSGAGGSIGSELCRQILLQKPSVLLLFEASEFALYAIEAELTEEAKRLQYQTRVVPILGSVQHRRRLEAVIKAFKVQTIYHAAAYKHVPLVEENVIEGIRNNVFGTLAFTLAARKFGVEKFILISTDKAVRPTNVMGASKRIAELICQAHGQEAGGTSFSMVRFGNVLGSSGSVIPRFRAQIEAGGPVTVTHKDITRYFMTIPEAAQLVIQAGALGQGGDVFVLDMGAPVKIIDLAFSMAKLHGLTPYMVDDTNQILLDDADHIQVSVTGLRKGEKLYEELLIGNNPEITKHPRIMTASEVSLPYDVLIPVLDRLLQACIDFDLTDIVAILHELPLGYAPLGEDTSDLLWNAVQDTERRPGVTVKAGSGA